MAATKLPQLNWRKVVIMNSARSSKGSKYSWCWCIFGIACLSPALLAERADTEQRIELQQQLRGLFALTTIAADRTTVTSQGTPLVLQKGGLVTYSTASPFPPQTAYKDGKFRQGFGSQFIREGVGQGLKGDTATYPPHRLTAGTRLWITKLYVLNNGIYCELYTDADQNGRYYGEVKFPFAKYAVPPIEEAKALIAEVLIASPQPVAEKPVAQPPAPPPIATPAPSSAPVPAIYVSTQTKGDYLQLKADSTFAWQVSGQSFHGTFVTRGNTIELNDVDDSVQTSATVTGQQLTDANGQTWVWSDRVPQPEAVPVSVSVPVPPPHKPGPVLKNNDIIFMAKSGLKESVILLKIAHFPCQFDTSVAKLAELSKSGVSEKVIEAMISTEGK